MLIKACLNGARTPGEHPALPVSPEQLATEAQRAVKAGAEGLHVHPRAADGAQTLDPGPFDAAMLAIRHACPGVPVGSSTASFIEPDPARRLELISEWTERPDFASANFREEGVLELCELLNRLGIGIEAGLSTMADAEALADSGWGHRLVRILVEPFDRDPAQAVAEAERITAVLDRADLAAPRLYHGFDSATWEVIEFGLEGGWDVRVGLEDTLQLPDGTTASGNADLVAAAVAMARKRSRL
ncbi:MAG: 3-keto-5-aminohexanoate cleavage protein [Candidatus Dormibacteraeota bacterium]|nr:3-keto-5-aminohexanoate cleavage protein [Candidatus Dormibacteraeota bacterium]